MVRTWLCLLGIASFAGPTHGQEAAKFTGTWKAATKILGFDHQLTITHEADQWSVGTAYFKNNAQVGSAQGFDVKFENGALVYTQKFVKKPAASWKDSKDVISLRFKGEQLEMTNVTTGKALRLYDRVGPAPVVAKVQPEAKPKVEAKVEPKKEVVKKEEPKPPPATDDRGFAGVWQGQYQGTSLKFVLTMKRVEQNYEVEGHVLDDANKYRGHFLVAVAKALPGKKNPTVIINGNWDAGLAASRSSPYFKATLKAGELQLMTMTGKTAHALRRETEEVLAALPALPKQVAKAKTDKAASEKTKTVMTLTLPAKVASTPVAGKLDLPGPNLDVWSMSRGGGRLAVGTNPGHLLVYDLASRKLLWKDDFKGASQGIRGVAVSGDGQWVACDDNVFPARKVRLFDGASGKPAPALASLKLSANLLAFHPTQPLLASYAGGLTVVNVAGGKQVCRTDNLHSSETWDLVFSASGARLATAGPDLKKTSAWLVRIIDAEKGTLVRDLPADKRPITCVAFARDDKHVAVYRGDFAKSSVTLYDTQSFEPVGEIPILGVTGRHHAMAFLADSKTLAVAGRDRHVRLIDYLTGQIRGVLTNVASVASSGDIIASEDGTELVVNAFRELRIYRIADAMPYPPPAAEK